MVRIIITLLFVSVSAFAQKADFKVLALYSKNVEGDHVEFAKKLKVFMTDLSDERNFTFDVTTDWSNLNDTLLRNYQVVMWINDFPHTEAQRKSFRKFMENGGGWIGFHVAGYNDETTKWPWFVDFMGGAVFYTNSWPPLPARLIIEDPKHPVTQNVPATIMAPTNEWYQWEPSPRENKNVKVLAALDPGNYPMGIKNIIPGGDTPVVWTNTKFNMVYINMGHGDFVMTDYFQNQLFADALLWVGKSKTPKPAAVKINPSYPDMIEVKGYKMAKTETTIAEWRTFCLATNRKMVEAPWFPQTEQHPVVNVSWDDAQAYCKWLSTVTGKNYRLPTEAEWEFAARGGNKSKGFPYSGGKNADSIGWVNHKSESTMPVAQKAPNELGLYDMTGNVWEWCSDWYDASQRFYTTRGGAWDIGLTNSKIEYRNPLAPTSRNHNKGFRVVCD